MCLESLQSHRPGWSREEDLLDASSKQAVTSRPWAGMHWPPPAGSGNSGDFTRAGPALAGRAGPQAGTFRIWGRMSWSFYGSLLR